MIGSFAVHGDVNTLAHWCTHVVLQIAHLEACVKDHENFSHKLQTELDAANQKLSVLKEQLMSSQTDAEESGRQMVEETANELRARHANELQRMNVKVWAPSPRILEGHG